MLMSKSRLEKFLYALYSLDSGDLPTPLSRIEELYKCLVTGDEAPTFEPLSRVEKYLMAILGVYDVELLPNPLSRVEVLLHKLATGDDNLDDVKSFLSEHEELLAEIIRNGGAGGNTDIEYVLYTLSTEFNTLYNTAKKPIKSAILKGNTMVNLWVQEQTTTTIEPSGWLSTFVSSTIKRSTKYILKYKVKQGNLSERLMLQFYKNNTWVVNEQTHIHLDKQYFIFTSTSSDFNKLRMFYHDSFGTETVVLDDIMLIEYQEGMENWDIPYFEGMKSVQMPVLTTNGSNLIPPFTEWEILNGKPSAYSISEKRVEIKLSQWYMGVSIKKQLKPNTVYTVGWDEISFNTFNFAGTNKVGDIAPFRTFTTGDSGMVTFTIKNSTTSGTFIIDGFRINEGDVDFGYAPFKSNILSTPSDLELKSAFMRDNSTIRDEINLLTGELKESTLSITLNGSENWVLGGFNASIDGYPHFTLNALIDFKQNSGVICKFPFKDYDLGGWKTYEGCAITTGSGYKRIMIRVNSDIATSVDEFKEWLKKNPFEMVLVKNTSTIKTVDLSVVNQDGNDTKLSTFNDITHVTLSSEGLIPEAELEVATKNEEVLNTMSLEMDDISTSQNTLKETTDIQSENVDATMIATTEIYEGLL